MVTVIFKEHCNGIVNAGTGEVMDCVDPAVLWAKLPEYAEIYPTLTDDERIAYERRLLQGAYNPFGGYEQWTEEQKAEWNELLGQYDIIELRVYFHSPSD
jgi:hypothetical protein